MDQEHLVDAVRREGGALADAARGHLDVPIPDCPGWDMTQLLNHLGRVHRWATQIVATRATEPVPFPGRPPAVTVEWFEEGVRDLADALAGADPDASMWNFRGLKSTTRFWLRRQAVETALHRWDAETAIGTAAPIATDVAIVGIDEALDVHLPYVVAQKEKPIDLGGAVHFHATDGEPGEWTVRIDGGYLLVGHGHEKGEAALRGAASDLLLFLWGRRAASELEAFGDTTLLDRWTSDLTLG